MKIEKEIGVIQLQAKEGLGPAEGGRGKEKFSSGALEERVFLASIPIKE